MLACLESVSRKNTAGSGGDFVAYALASEELGRHCATTGLTFNMHVATTLLVGQIADDMDLPDDVRATQHARREQLWHGVVNNHTIHSQPFSEGTAASATGGFATMAKKVDGGYLVTGRKIFASLSGAANVHNVVCISDADDQLHLMGVPADADGVEIEGGWDPLGMRGHRLPQSAHDRRVRARRQRVDSTRHVRAGRMAVAVLLYDVVVLVPGPHAEHPRLHQRLPARRTRHQRSP